MMTMVKRFLIWLFAVILLFTGVNHVLNPEMYAAFIPDWMPLPAVNYVVGVIEFGLGVLLLIDRYQSIAAACVLLLMIFFLPFHIVDACRLNPEIGSSLVAYIRLVLQFVLILWAWYLKRR